MLSQEEVDRRFAHHAPDGDKADRHDTVRGACAWLGGVIDATCPDGREKSLALTKVEEAMMWANAAIARTPPARAIPSYPNDGRTALGRRVKDDPRA